MSFFNALPEHLKSADKKTEVIEYLKSLPVRAHYKKYTFLEWANVNEIMTTFEDYEKLGIIF